jgi:drug/metabolite transporter (DMT)-like permease
MTTASQHRWALALIFITPALWAVNYIVARVAPGQIGPHALALMRWGCAGLLLAGFAWRELVAQRHLIRAEWPHCLVLGVLGMWICGAWVYIAGQTTVATNIALIYALSPVFIALASVLWLHERLRGSQWLGIALALVGLVHVVVRGDWSQLARLQFVVGDVWIVLCSISWAVYSVLLKRWPTAFSPLARLVLIITGGVSLLLPLALVEAWAAAHWNLPLYTTQWNLKTALIVAAAALMPGAGAYLAYATMSKHLGASRAALTLYLGPLYGAFMAWLVLAEPVRLHHVVGAGIILPGIWLASRSE